MDDNKSEGSEKGTLRRKASLQKLSKLGKAIRKRLPKTPKTDRGPASSFESETGSVRSKKSGSLTSRLKKRFSSTSRRSMSVTDLDNLSQTEGAPEEDLDDDEPSFLMTRSAQPDFLPAVARDFPTPSDFDSSQRRIQQISINSENSGSSPLLPSGAEELSEAEFKSEETRRSRRPSNAPWMDEVTKEMSEQERTTAVVDSDPQDYFQQGVKIVQYTPYNTQKEQENARGASMDAAASIEVGIEETVRKSLYYSSFGVDSSVPKPEQESTEPSLKKETTNEPLKLEQKITEESPKLEDQTAEASLKLEQDITEDPSKPGEEITEERSDSMNEVARVTAREVDLTVMERPSEVTPAEDQDEGEGAPSKEVFKPRKGRFRRFLLREAPISLATMAVGLLFLVFKSRANGRRNART